MRIKSLLAVGISAALLASLSDAPSNAAGKPQTVTGQFGESISAIAQDINVGKDGQAQIVVTGKGFDETVGIYLAFCLMPKAGGAPTPCGGGVNKSGIGDASYWISSNPPPYGIGLAIPFTPGGRFKETVSITRKIGSFDCRKVKCAITVRSDHLHEGDRSHDIFIPITIK